MVTGKPCQDAFKTRNLKNKACIALADGAGSRRHSREGANAIVKAVSRWSLDEFDQLYDGILEDRLSISLKLISRFVSVLDAKSQRANVTLSDFASTLMFFACDRARYIAGHIGDGAIIAQFGDQHTTLSEPDNGEFANVTYFVTDPLAHQRLRLYAGQYQGALSALLMTDGVTDSLYDKNTRLAGPGVARLLQLARELPAKTMKDVLKANLEKVISGKTADDCSIATLVYIPPGDKENF